MMVAERKDVSCPVSLQKDVLSLTTRVQLPVASGPALLAVTGLSVQEASNVWFLAKTFVAPSLLRRDVTQVVNDGTRTAQGKLESLSLEGSLKASNWRRSSRFSEVQ